MSIKIVLSLLDAALGSLFVKGLLAEFAVILILCLISVCLINSIGMVERRWEFETKKDAFVPFLIPGILVHELSHVVVCGMGGVKGLKLRINIRARCGFITLSSSQILETNPFIAFLISIAPILGGVSVFSICQIMILRRAHVLLLMWGFWMALSTLLYFCPSKLDFDVFCKALHQSKSALLTAVWMVLCMGFEYLIAAILPAQILEIPFIHWWIWVGLIWGSAVVLQFKYKIHKRKSFKMLMPNNLSDLEEEW